MTQRERDYELIKIRERYHMSQAEFAEACGIGVTALRRTETGEIKRTKRLMDAIADYEERCRNESVKRILDFQFEDAVSDAYKKILAISVNEILDTSGLETNEDKEEYFKYINSKINALAPQAKVKRETIIMEKE